MPRWIVVVLCVAGSLAPVGCGAEPAAVPASSPTPEVRPTTAPLLPSIPEQFEIDALGVAQRGRRVTVHGYLIKDTTERKPGTSAHRFGLARRSAVLRVEYDGPLPPDFVEQREVIATGILGLDGTTMVADEVISRCPEDYEELGRATP